VATERWTRRGWALTVGSITFGWFARAILLSGALQGALQGDDTAAQDSDEPVVALGPGVTPPRVTHQVTPDSDPGAAGFRISGTVLIGLIVSSHGMPREVRVLRSLEKNLDRNAVAAVQQWRFEPARKGNDPVAVRMSIEIRFRDL